MFDRACIRMHYGDHEIVRMRFSDPIGHFIVQDVRQKIVQFCLYLEITNVDQLKRLQLLQGYFPLTVIPAEFVF